MCIRDRIQEDKGQKMEINFNQVYFLSEHFENFLRTFEINIKSKNNERILGNKMLEIESLIGLTEITYSENENLEGFFQNILLNYISTLNASCGLIFILDENSGSFNVLAELNLSNLKVSNKIIRANKGIFKDLDEFPDSDEDELEESKMLWDNLISSLKQILGSS